MILGVGIDLIDVARVEREVSRPGHDLLDELFTSAERAASAALRRAASGHAARYAVKEACVKALGTGKVGRMAWRDIEVTLPRSGAAAVALGGETARVAAELGVDRMLAAVSVTRSHAIAWVVALGGRDSGLGIGDSAVRHAPSGASGVTHRHGRPGPRRTREEHHR